MTDAQRDAYEQAKVSGPEPERYIALSEVQKIVKRIMSEADMLTSDSEDYRIGQWAGAEKVGFAIDCHVSTRSETARTYEQGLEDAAKVCEANKWRGSAAALQAAIDELRALAAAQPEAASPADRIAELEAKIERMRPSEEALELAAG